MNPETRPPVDRHALLIPGGFILFFMVFGAWLRFEICHSDSVWLDELHTGWVIDAPFSDIWERATSGNQTPLYFYLSKLGVETIGQSEIGLRFVGWMASVLTIGLGAFFIWHRTRKLLPVCLTGGLLAFTCEFVYYGTEARPYSMLHLLSLAQVFCLSQIIEPKDPKGSNRWLILLVLLTVALVYTHLTAVLLLAAEAFFVLTWWVIGNPEDRRKIARLSIAAIISLTICVPLIGGIHSTFGRRENWASVASLDRLWTDAWSVLVAQVAIPLAVLVINWFIGDSSTKAERGDSKDRSRSLGCNWLIGWLVLFWAIIPFAGIVVAELAGIPMGLTRYAQIGYVGMPVFAGLVLGQIPNVWTRSIIFVAIIGASLFFDPVARQVSRTHSLPVLHFEDWKAPIEQINLNEEKKTHPVFLFSNLIEDVDALTNGKSSFQEYLGFPLKSLYPVDLSNRELKPRPTANLTDAQFSVSDIQLTGEQGGCWILVRGTPDIVMEKKSQFEQLMENVIKRTPETIRMSVFEVPNSNVYLVSVDL